jgi:hypothetical protein
MRRDEKRTEEMRIEERKREEKEADCVARSNRFIITRGDRKSTVLKFPTQCPLALVVKVAENKAQRWRLKKIGLWEVGWKYVAEGHSSSIFYFKNPFLPRSKYTKMYQFKLFKELILIARNNKHTLWAYFTKYGR